MNFAGDDCVDIVGEHCVTSHEAHGESHAVALQTVEADIEADLPSLNSRRPAKVANGTARDLLEPDGLPDAGSACIPDGMRLELPVLFAARLGEIVRVVFGANDDGLEFDAIVEECLDDIAVERRAAALVARDQVPVHPDGRFVVDGAEV